ncbi:hypothetical protein [Novimethylophilus kurashikiensis]|uniref:hypothetical protein n=1 Tax=Novimethylophilus kurashikiensis TaxID=1825523 RepID=UPI000D592617|nr:hypothetical protein [Novimethylophilus kurashikiensis]
MKKAHLLVGLMLLAATLTSNAATVSVQDTPASRLALAKKITLITVDADGIRKELDKQIEDIPYIQRVPVAAELKKLTPEAIRNVNAQVLADQFTYKELEVILMSETHKAEMQSVPGKLGAYNSEVNERFKAILKKAFDTSTPTE